MEGGWVNHRLDMGLVRRRYGGLGGDKDGGGGWEACGTKAGGNGHISGDAGAHSNSEVGTLMAPDHITHSCEALGRV